MKRHILRWVENINENEKRSTQEAQQVINQLETATADATNNVHIGKGMMKTGAAVAPLTFAGMAVFAVGGLIDSLSTQTIGSIVTGIGTIGAPILLLAGSIIRNKNEQLARLAMHKKRVIFLKEMDKKLDVEEVEDEIQ